MSFRGAAETNLISGCERGHLDNLNTGQKCRRWWKKKWNNKSQSFFGARCPPRRISTWFIHLERLWLSIISSWSEETRSGRKSQKPCEVKVAFTAPALLRMFSVGDVGEHLQLAVLFRFFLSLFVRGEGFWEHKHLFFQRWIKFDSQLGRKIFIVFFKRNYLCKMVIVCKCKTSVKVCLYECLHKYLSLCRSGGEGL